ncbi:MAG: hypothetical protein ACRD1R_10330 [Acidobacteriota bacterium]
MSENSLAHLEQSLCQVLDLLKALQAENEDLNKEIQELKQHLEELKEANQLKSQQIERFESDRLKIRSRVEKIVRNIADLEEPIRDSV